MTGLAGFSNYSSSFCLYNPLSSPNGTCFCPVWSIAFLVFYVLVDINIDFFVVGMARVWHMLFPQLFQLFCFISWQLEQFCPHAVGKRFYIWNILCIKFQASMDYLCFLFSIILLYLYDAVPIYAFVKAYQIKKISTYLSNNPFSSKLENNTDAANYNAIMLGMYYA